MKMTYKMALELSKEMVKIAMEFKGVTSVVSDKIINKGLERLKSLGLYISYENDTELISSMAKFILNVEDMQRTGISEITSMLLQDAIMAENGNIFERTCYTLNILKEIESQLMYMTINEQLDSKAINDILDYNIGLQKMFPIIEDLDLYSFESMEGLEEVLTMIRKNITHFEEIEEMER